MRITVLAGGIGGARFLRGLTGRTSPTPRSPSSATPATTSGCTGCACAPTSTPSCTPSAAASARSAAGAARARPSPSRTSWRRTASSRRGSASATRTSPPTSSARSRSAPATRSPQVTAALCEHWQPGVRLLPMSDDRAETHVVVDDPSGGAAPDGTPLRTAIHFQEWWIRYRASLPAHGFALVGIDSAQPGPDVVEAIMSADVVLFPPSNPVVSIGTILQVPGIADAVRSTRGTGGRRLPHRRRRARARHGRRLPHRDRASRPPRAPSRPTTAARANGGLIDALAGRHRRRGAPSRRWRRPASAASPCPR